MMGIKEDLTLRLLEYAREHLTEFLKTSPQPELDNLLNPAKSPLYILSINGN
jgi:hypothetical protein